MIKRKSTLELAISGAMPFTALILVALANFVSFGFKIPDASFWIDAVINTVALLCFFLPFKSIFIDKKIDSERIKSKQEAYTEMVEKVYDDRLVDFEKWTEKEFNERRARIIRIELSGLRLENADAKFNEYGFDIRKIKKDKCLSNYQKKIMIKLIKKVSKLKKIDTDKCLPGIDSIVEDNRLSSNMEKEEKKQTIIKVLRSLIVCAGIAMLTFTTDFSDLQTRYMAILMSLGLKLLIGLWHIYGASRLAHTLVNKVYFNELSEKSLVITEFLECEKRNKLHN